MFLMDDHREDESISEFVFVPYTVNPLLGTLLNSVSWMQRGGGENLSLWGICRGDKARCDSSWPRMRLFRYSCSRAGTRRGKLG
jgi:hypothetical protein